MNRGSNPAGLCWLSTPLVQCGLDEPSWTWTQIWVQARLPGYSLNWTTGSSAIQGWQRCQWYSLPTQSWLSRSRRPFDLESAINIRYPSGANVRRTRVLVLCEMQSVSSRIWTRIAVFISYGDNDYTTVWIQLFSFQLWVNSRADWVLQPWWGN